jgi:hypothetical protein
MKLAIGIISIIAGLWFLYGTIRMWPPGDYPRLMTGPSTKTDIARGVVMFIAAFVTGIALITGASWWWLLVAVATVILWAAISALAKRQ